eukprot:CAMPEP_0179147138 /NCGR_PEP_ID=MMETSP0796-20121207/71110_1 /TAXON_ID=73915 /ORGANISM="Pyrodinium bahamense, Strain pbaha01" /LENGTH=39 /DNA_ID= /DNA_START= /DNA_END= /DNA_ORIENTATION=
MTWLQGPSDQLPLGSERRHSAYLQLRRFELLGAAPRQKG